MNPHSRSDKFEFLVCLLPVAETKPADRAIEMALIVEVEVSVHGEKLEAGDAQSRRKRAAFSGLLAR